jgi:putative tricarboxylic transport membrane protein
VDLFQRVRALPEWKEFVETGAFQDTTLSGPGYADWLQSADHQHRTLMKEAGFLSP